MCEYASIKSSARRRFFRDETGSTAGEWVVAAAIVGLFSIPVIALINSGTQQRSEPVVAALEDPESEEARKAYSVGGREGDGGNFGDIRDRQVDEGKEAPAGYAGLNKGVGYDIDVSDVTNSDRGTASGFAVSRRSAGVSSGGPSTSNTGNSSNAIPNGGSSSDATPRPLRAPSASNDDIRRRRVAGIVSAPRVIRPTNPSVAPGADSVDRDVRCVGTQAKTVFTQPQDIKTQDDLNAALVDNVDEDKIDALLDNVRIRILDEEAPVADPDCPEQELASVAPEQLEDGTILGSVTISTNNDQLPARRQLPGGIAEAPSLEDTTLGQSYTARLKAERLPIPRDREALAKILGDNVEATPPLAPSARRAPSPMIPNNIQPNAQAAERPKLRIAAAASAALGQSIVSLPPLEIANVALQAIPETELSVGAKSTVSVGVSVVLPTILKRDVPILRSGR